MTTKYQRQWTEFEAIKSIYEKEFEEIKFPWKIDHPPWFKINLMGGFVIEFRMTKVYPDGVPEIKVQCSDPEVSVSELEQKLKKEAEGLVGNEMCFDLIEMAREYCEIRQKKGKTSFHSEMLKKKEERDKKASDLQAIEMQKCEEQLRKAKKAEMEELEKKIREELKEKLVVSTDKKESKNSFYSGTRFEFEPPITVDNNEISSVQSVGNETGNWTFGKSLRVNCDSEEFQLKIVNLSHPFLQTFGGRRQLEILLKNLKNHSIERNENVLRCFGGSVDKENNEMYILSEASSTDSVTLDSVVEQAGSLAIGRVLEYLKQICGGLSHLHASGLTHRNLNLECLLVDSKRRLKVSDYLVYKCLSDLSREHGISFDNYTTAELDRLWMAPEVTAKPNFHGKKVDIWSLGKLTIQMLFGRESLKCWPAGFKDLLKSAEWQGIPEGMREFLRACLNEDAGKRLTAEELLGCKIFVEPVMTTGISHDIKTAKAEVKEIVLTKAQVTKPVTASSSRYLTDFEELEFLGRGGFGSVVKVRNKIDDRFYAVKKIALDPRDVEYNKKILREVTTLSRLHHERIIRYYQAWIEDSSEDLVEGEGSEYSGTSVYTAKNSKTVTFKSKPIDLSLGPKSFKPFSGLEEIEFDSDESEESGNNEYDDFVQFENENSDDSEGSEIITSDNSSSEDSSSEYSNNRSYSRSSDNLLSGDSLNLMRGQVLYIQMEYCPNQTLRDLIDERAADPTSHFLDPPEIWRLFRQIVEGLVHIHAQGMMHRDLKPSNIFLDSNGDVKIGDFGLAVTRLESTVNAAGMRCESPMQFKPSAEKSFTGESHTQNIGTPFYVSPEQITSSVSARYNQKVDMYSLGIILIELWVPFGTGMERVQSLQKCRLPEVILPEGLEEENVIKIAKRLLCHDPKKRFTSLELLRSDLLPPMLEEELMEDALRSVAQPGAPHYPRLISTIFKRLEGMDFNQIRPKDFAFDVHSGNATEINEETGRMKKEIERVFLRYGGVEVDPPLLYLPLSESQGYCVLDDAGQRLELPNNLTRPFARWVAQSSLQIRGCLKRYSINRVFKKISQVSGGQPYQPDEASFDLVHVEDEKGILETCEVVRVMIDSVMTATVGAIKAEQLVIKVNHLRVRERILRDAVRGFEEAPWNFAGPGIQRVGSGVFDEKVTRVLTAVKSDEPAESQIQRLMSFYGNELKPVLIYLSDLLAALQKISIPAKTRIVFDPLMAGPRADLYKDEVCFVLLRENNVKRYAGHEVIGCGGRYNLLVEEYKFPTARLEGKGPFAVGMSLFLDKILTPKQQQQQQQIKIGKQPRLIVLNLIGETANSDEFWLIGELWRLGRGGNLIVNRNGGGGGDKLTNSSIQLQVKATGKRVLRVKWRAAREVEEISLEEIGQKLKMIEESEDLGSENDVSVNAVSSEFATAGESVADLSSGGDVHFVLSAGKAERNPILREKASKALKLVNPSKSEIVIHELPRDILKRFLYDNTTRSATGGGGGGKVSEEFRDQLTKMGQLLQGKLAGKTVIFVNHKDNQIDIIFNK